MAIAVRGQRLFIRPITPADHASVREFLGAEPPASGAIGKLVGDLVAVASTTETNDALILDDLVVAPELRRKRVGRVMIDELVNIARTMKRTRLVVEDPRDAAEFLRKVGFTQHGDRWERSV